MNVHLKNIDDANRAEVKRLKTARDQRDFICPNAVYIRQARAQKSCKTYALYDEDILIGFTFFGSRKCEKQNRLWLYAFMIAEDFQGKGYGKNAFILLLEKINEEYPNRSLFLSVHPKNEAAITIYERHGFVCTGEVNRYKENIMVLKKNPDHLCC